MRKVCSIAIAMAVYGLAGIRAAAQEAPKPSQAPLSNTPTLIQHGENDRRVPIPNAYELRQALEDRGVPVKMAVYKGFGHGIMKPKQQRAVLEENEKWFAQYIWGEKLEEPKAPEPKPEGKKSAAAVNP